MQFGETDLDVSELDVTAVTSTDAATVTFELQSVTGDVRYTIRLDLEPNVPRPLFERVPGMVRASRLHVALAGPPHRTNIWLQDLRVLGQRPELAAYISKTLTFSTKP